jgi:hypothetical protein
MTTPTKTLADLLDELLSSLSAWILDAQRRKPVDREESLWIAAMTVVAALLMEDDDA